MKPRKRIARSTKPLKRTPLKRGKPPRKVNPKRKAVRFERDFGGAAYVEWIQRQPCILSGEPGNGRNRVVAAHVKGRGAGGRAQHIVPMLRTLHDEAHLRGLRTTIARFCVTEDWLLAMADQYRSKFLAEQTNG